MDTVPFVPKPNSLLTSNELATTRVERIEDRKDAKLKMPHEETGKISGAGQTDEPTSSVSWHVPHGKHPQENPGFNLGYSQPKTHPPHDYLNTGVEIPVSS